MVQSTASVLIWVEKIETDIGPLNHPVRQGLQWCHPVIIYTGWIFLLQLNKAELMRKYNFVRKFVLYVLREFVLISVGLKNNTSCCKQVPTSQLGTYQPRLLCILLGSRFQAVIYIFSSSGLGIILQSFTAQNKSSWKQLYNFRRYSRHILRSY